MKGPAGPQASAVCCSDGEIRPNARPYLVPHDHVDDTTPFDPQRAEENIALPFRAALGFGGQVPRDEGRRLCRFDFDFVLLRLFAFDSMR